MSETRGHDSESRPAPSMSERVDRVCDQFEAAWNRALQGNSPRPRIEDYLDQGPGDGAEELFRELLASELDLLARSQQRPSIEEYRRRFPGRAETIDAVFQEASAPRRLGDYQLLEPLGCGGMGMVYRARHRMLDQVVALKVLPQRYLEDRHAVSRFRREMKLIGRLNHPNIVRAHNAGEVDGVQFLVMEYVEGITLQRLVSEHGPLPLGGACEILRQAALGLEHAFRNNLVHRDLKPANLMLSNDGTVKILDLGLARFRAEPGLAELSGEQLSQEGIVLGTVDYMAPEQWEDARTVDIRADIYSLGCTFFYLLTARPPYGSESYDTTGKKMKAHMLAPIPALAAHRNECPEELDRVFGRMMAKEAKDRFSTPAEVADAIGPFAKVDEIRPLAARAGRAAFQAQIDSVRDVGDAGLETPRWLPRPAEPSETDRSRKGSRTRRHRRVAATALGLFGIGLAVVLAVWIARNGRSGSGDDQPGPDEISEQNRPDEAPPNSLVGPPAGNTGDNESRLRVKAAVAALERLHADPSWNGEIVQGLYLHNPNVTPAELAPIRDLRDLTWIMLSDVPVTDAGMEHFKDLTSLGRLTLRNAQITDAGLKRLRGLKELRILQLDDNAITDDGLVHLYGLTALRTVTLFNTQVTPEGVRQLREALPLVEVTGVFPARD